MAASSQTCQDDEKIHDNNTEQDQTKEFVYHPRITTYELARRTQQPAAHVYHAVAWRKYVDIDDQINQDNHSQTAHASQIQLKILEANKDAFTLSNLFSVKECQRLIYLSECHGYAPLLSVLQGRTYRTNTRVIFDDPSLSQLLYERMRAFLPKYYKINGETWELYGLNERFRFCKYTKDQHFNIHNDKRVLLPKERKASFYTVNIYLNDGRKDFQGGRTLFFNVNGGNNSNNSKKDRYQQSSFVVPQPGLALVFNHFPEKYKHCGETVLAGCKYIARTDVMYKRQRIQQQKHKKRRHSSRW